MAKIYIGKGYYTEVDDKYMVEICLLFTPYPKIDTHNVYAYIWYKGKDVPLHQYIGAKIGLKGKLDHINGDSLDNKEDNLRSATNSQNQANRGRQVNNTTGYKGVSCIKSNGRYHAQIKVNNIKIHLGNHKTAEEAHEAYKKAALKYFGPFAKF